MPLKSIILLIMSDTFMEMYLNLITQFPTVTNLPGVSGRGTLTSKTGTVLGKLGWLVTLLLDI